MPASPHGFFGPRELAAALWWATPHLQPCSDLDNVLISALVAFRAFRMICADTGEICVSPRSPNLEGPRLRFTVVFSAH